MPLLITTIKTEGKWATAEDGDYNASITTHIKKKQQKATRELQSYKE